MQHAVVVGGEVALGQGKRSLLAPSRLPIGVAVQLLQGKLSAEVPLPLQLAK